MNKIDKEVFLWVSGFLTSLVGSSKMGKTILCEKVIGFEHIVEVSGADFDEDTDLWKLVSAKAGFAYEGQFASEKQIPSSSKMPYAGNLKPV